MKITSLLQKEPEKAETKKSVFATTWKIVFNLLHAFLIGGSIVGVVSLLIIFCKFFSPIILLIIPITFLGLIVGTVTGWIKW